MRRLTILGLAFGLVLLSCGREVTGPGAAAVRFARGLSFAAIFPPLYQQASGASGVSFNRVHVVLHHSDGTVALDTVINFPSDSSSVSLSLTVPLLASAPVSGEPLTLNLGYLNAAGDTVFKGGPIAVTAAPSVPGQPPPPPVSVPVAYTGPGASASTVRVSPKSLNIFIGDRFTVSAQALDPDGKAISGTPIIYASLDNGVATLSSAGSGAGIAVGRGTARIVAQLLTGPVDTAIIQVQAHATTIASVSGDGQTAITGAKLTQPVVVKVTASDGLGVSGVSVAFSASGGGAVDAATVVTDASGLAQTNWKLGPTVGGQTLTASASGLSGSPVTFTATASQAPATKLAVSTQPTSGRANAIIAPPVTITAQDVNGNTTTAFTGPVTVAFGSNVAGATLGGTTTVNAIAGVATFSGLTITKAGTGYTLVASSGALTTATSNLFDITVGSATKLAFTVTENGSTGGAILTPPITVAAEDSIGNVVTGFTGTVQLSFGNNPTGAALSGTTSVNAVAGIATFSDIRVNLAGSYTLVASSTGLTPSTSPGFDVIVGPASQIIVVSGGGQTAPSGATLTPIVVRVSDAGTNGVAGKNMTFAVTSGGGTLTPSTAVGDGQGRASFTWTLGGAAGVQTVTVTSPGVTPLVVSATASGNGATQLVVTTQPGATYAAGASITPSITVEARNGVNALSTAFTGSVSIAIGANPGTSTLSGTATVNAIAGVATFSGLSLNKSGAGYTLVASSSGLTSATTTSFAITPGPATSIVISAGNFQTASPSTVLPLPIVAHVVDALGNGVSGKTVTFAVATGGGSLSVASAATDASGNASSVWTLGAAAGPQTLTVASVGLTGSPLTVTANGGGGAVASTVVTPHLDTLTAIGATFGLAAQAKDISLANVTGAFVWVSRVPAVATVNASGVVTGVTNGSTWVVATESGGTKDSSFIVVQQRLATINVTPSPRNIYLGASFPFAASAVDGLGIALQVQPAFTWSTASSAISSITAAGVATGVGLGSTQVRATSGAVVGVATLNVLSPISRIVVSRDSAGFSTTVSDTFTIAALGRSRSYKATAYDTLNVAMSGITFTFGSSNASVAAIDSTGTVTVRATAAANGSTSITASAQGISGTASLKVRQVLTSIDLSPTAATIAPTGTVALLARGKDANGFFISGGTFNFLSANPSIATVGAGTGVVTGVANGSATITAKDSSNTITSNNAIITVGLAGPSLISFGRDTLTVGRSGSASIPVYLSKPNALPMTINLAVRDTFAFFSPTSIVIPAGNTSGNATLNGHNAGSTLIYATDGSALGYTPDTAVLAVQATVRLTSSSYSLTVNDQLSTQVLLSDPSPAGGTYITYSYGTAGRAAVSPDPAFIPAGQLAANIVILGTGTGQTTITPAATGVNGTSSLVTMSSPVLTFQPSSMMLGAGQFQYNQYIYVPTYLYSPLGITLASADTNTVTVPTSLTITSGTNYVYFNTAGKIPGLVTVTGTASGWTTGTMSVRVTSPKLGLSGGGTLNTTSPAQGVTVYAEDSLSSAHYRTSSLAVQLSSSDTTVLKVLNPALTIPAGQYYVNTGQVIPGGAGGNAWLKVTASGHKPDSVSYTVVGPKLNFNWYSNVVGAGQQDNNVYVYAPNNVTAPLTVSISNPDSTIVGLPTAVTIPAGNNYVFFSVRGKAVGNEMFIASATGYQPDTAFYTVSTPRLSISGGGTLNNFVSAQGFTTYATDSLRNAHYRTTPLIVTYTSTNPAVFTVTNSTDTVPAGLYYANHVQITPVGVGTAKLIASAPGHGSDTVSYTVQTPPLGFSISHSYIGKRQYEPSGAYVYIPNGRATPVTVTITHTNPAADSLSSTTLIIPANQNYLYFGYAGLATGNDTLTATAPGYLSTTAIITVTSQKFSNSSLPSTALTTSTPATVTIYSVDTLGNAHYSLDTIVIRAVSSNIAVIQPTAPSSRLARGVYYAQPTVAFTGPGTASMTYSDSLLTGYPPMTTNTVTVTGPSLGISNSTTILGMRQNGGAGSAYVYVQNAVTGSPLVVNLVSSSPSVVSVPATVTIPVGSSYAYFQITADTIIGTIQITATASGYGGANTNVQVTAPKFYLTTAASVNTTSPRQTITLYAQDANGNAHYVNQGVTVTLASSSSAVGSIDSASVVIPAGQYYNNVAQFIPGSAGTTQLSATDARAVSYRYSTATQSVAVNTPTLYLNWGTSMTLGLGQYEDHNVQTPDNVVSALTVSLAHFNAASSTPASVIIPTSSSYNTVRVSGAAVGTDTITASATAYNSYKGAVIVGLGRTDPISSWPTTLSLLSNDSVLVTMYARDQGTTTHYVTAATTFTLTGTANIGFVTGGASSVAITSVTIPANAYYVQFWVKGLTTGTSTVSISNANYTTYSSSITVTP